VGALDLARSGYLLTDMGALPNIHQWQFGLMDELRLRSGRLEVVTQGGEFVLQDYLGVRDGASIERESIELFDQQTDRFVPAPSLMTGSLEDSGSDLARVTVGRLDAQELEASARWYYRDAPKDLVDEMLRYGIAYSDIAELRRHARRWGFALSSRLHGGILSLNEGIPTAFAVHDYRLKELVELYRLPNLSFESDQSLADDWLGNLEWPPLTELRARLKVGFAEFFEANGVAHRI